MPNLDAKVCVIHVGAHKTGTTALQGYLRSNAKLLHAHRILYINRPELAISISWGLALINSPDLFQAHLDALDADDDVDMLVASHEDTLGHPFLSRHDGRLYPSAERNLDALSRALEGRAARVVLSIRPQAEFLESYYLQTIHEGSTKSFEEWLLNVDLESLSWRPIVSTLVEKFGADNVKLVDFRLIQEGQEAYLHYFLKQLEPRLELHVKYQAARNRSVSEKGLQMARSANHHLRKAEDRRAMRKFLQTHFSNADYPRAMLFSEQQRASLWERYGAEYEELVGGGPAARALP